MAAFALVACIAICFLPSAYVVGIFTIALIGCATLAVLHGISKPSLPIFSNTAGIALGTHQNAITRQADAVLAWVGTGADTAGYLVKEGTTAGSTVAIISAASDEPLGVALDGADAIGDPVAIGMLGNSNITRKMVAKAAIAIGGPCYSDGTGKVTVEPTTAGVYWLVGTAKTTAAADGDVLEVETCKPVRVQLVTVTGAADVAALITALKTMTHPGLVMFI